MLLVKLRLRGDEVAVLLAEERVARLGLLVFLDGGVVHGPEVVELRLERRDLLGDFVPIRGHASVRHFVGRDGLDLRRALVGEGNGDALAADVVEDELILLLDALAEVLHLHRFLRQLDVDRATAALKLAELLAALAQAFFAQLDVTFLRGLLRAKLRDALADLLALVLEPLDLVA